MPASARCRSSFHPSGCNYNDQQSCQIKGGKVLSFSPLNNPSNRANQKACKSLLEDCRTRESRARCVFLETSRLFSTLFESTRWMKLLLILHRRRILALSSVSLCRTCYPYHSAGTPRVETFPNGNLRQVYKSAATKRAAAIKSRATSLPEDPLFSFVHLES